MPRCGCVSDLSIYLLPVYFCVKPQPVALSNRRLEQAAKLEASLYPTHPFKNDQA